FLLSTLCLTYSSTLFPYTTLFRSFSWNLGSENSTPTPHLCRIRQADLEVARILVHVLVAAAGEVEDGQVGPGHFWYAFEQAGNGMRGFKRRNDPFGAREQARGIESGLIRGGRVFGAALVREPGVLRADGGRIEPRGNGMRGRDL